jgi:RNA polymerase sigma-70 factor (ECF subfamily)
MIRINVGLEEHTAVTRASLLQGMQAGEDDRWREFHRVYAPVIRGFALKAGLTETEADDVVQETCIGVSRNVGAFQYDPEKCRFKTWLLNLASWRVKNQFTKRQRWDERVHSVSTAGHRQDSTETGTIERIPDLNADRLDTIWEEQWRADLMKTAMERVRAKFNPTHLQIFDLAVLKQWPAADIARSLGVSIPGVYLAKHRISAAIKKEMGRLERL